jgi:hypothetical protein
MAKKIRKEKYTYRLSVGRLVPMNWEDFNTPEERFFYKRMLEPSLWERLLKWLKIK